MSNILFFYHFIYYLLLSFYLSFIFIISFYYLFFIFLYHYVLFPIEKFMKYVHILVSQRNCWRKLPLLFICDQSSFGFYFDKGSEIKVWFAIQLLRLINWQLLFKRKVSLPWLHYNVAGEFRHFGNSSHINSVPLLLLDFFASFSNIYRVWIVLE